MELIEFGCRLPLLLSDIQRIITLPELSSEPPSLSGASATPGDHGGSVIAQRVVLAYWLLGTPGQFDEVACCAHIFDRRRKPPPVAQYLANGFHVCIQQER
jgi:hypothetical protein